MEGGQVLQRLATLTEENMKFIARRPDTAYLDTMLWIPRGYIDVDGTKRALSYEIPTYSGQSQFIYLWREAEHHMLLPRAFWNPEGLPFPVVDCRPRHYEYVAFKSRIRLDHLPQLRDGKIQLLPTGKDVQQRSIDALGRNPSGILQLACGRGKTVIALEKIARSQAPALVIIDNTNLLEQWREEATKLLDIPGGIGLIAEGKKDWKKALVLATYHSVSNWADTMPEEVRRWFFQVFYEEGHHANAWTFSRTTDLFYGNRYSLTATPNRDDGMHVIADAHIGKVLYKDLRPMMKPDFSFYWTGLKLDLADPAVSRQVMDTNQEVHLRKVYSFFGQWRDRLAMILDMCREARSVGRRVLVLSDSVAEIVNLHTLWSGRTALYSDIPIPTPLDVGETLTPHKLTDKDYKITVKAKERLEAQYARKFAKDCSSPDLDHIAAEIRMVEQALRQHEIHVKIENELRKRQQQFINQELGYDGDAGFLTRGVPAKKRHWFLDNKMLNFAITKYGKEGLDCQELDTIVLSSLFSSGNSLQQLMGRPTRPMPGKKNPLIIALVDDVGQCIGMSKKLQHHLRSWPVEEGGPYEPILVGHPSTWTTKRHTARLTDLFSR